MNHKLTSNFSTTYYSDPEHTILHREDGPAWTFGDDWAWYFNGYEHRTDGPASYENGIYMWSRHGKLHRDDGPAVIHPDGRVEYYCENNKIPACTNEEFFQYLKVKAFL